MPYILFYALYIRLSMCKFSFAIPGSVCDLFIAGDAQAPARAATVTTCDLAASLSDREVETNFFRVSCVCVKAHQPRLFTACGLPCGGIVPPYAPMKSQ